MKRKFVIDEEISFLKEIKEDSKVGYSGSYMANKNIKVATIPIGYADGMPRCLSNIGEVLINGYKANIIGKIKAKTHNEFLLLLTINMIVISVTTAIGTILFCSIVNFFISHTFIFSKL